jgi:hypothetical protein
VYSDRLDSIIIDGQTISSMDILQTLSMVELHCSGLTSIKLHEHMKQPGPPNQRHRHQTYCIAAMFFLKHHGANNNWNAFNDDVERWDSAVAEILDAYPEPFAITIFNTERAEILFPAK